jgi:acyl-CoA synthetase (AMP-forming)/AMP-acid ligase II/thioesterase domain-containing protein
MSSRSAVALGTEPRFSTGTTPIVEAIAAHASSSGDRVAVYDGATKLTYRELMSWAAALAEEIRALPNPASRIGIFLPGSAAYIVAILAMLMAGRTSVPMNDSDPKQRIRRIIGRCDLGAVIVDSETAPSMREIAPNLRQILASPKRTTISSASPRCAVVSPDHIFMISFTSGSTDEPKGVCWADRSFSSPLEYFVPELPLTSDDRVPILESATSAHSVKVALSSIFVGAPLGIFDMKRFGLSTTRRLLGEFRPTVYSIASSTFRALFRPDDSEIAGLVSDVRWVRFGRERVLYSDVKLYRRRFPTICPLVVAVGATETSTFASWCIDPTTSLDPGPIPVGFPPKGVDLELIGDDGVAVGAGEIGEIFVTSPTLAAGYWRDETLTDARFSPSTKFPAKTRFRTGDFGRFLPNGMLEFIGRRDRQVKIRGNTVHLGEVESVLADCPGVAEVGIVARQAADETMLVAYCTPLAGSALAEEPLRQWCRKHLSAPMRPTYFFMLAGLLRLPSGKVDLIELAALDRQQMSSVRAAVATERPAASVLSGIVSQAWTSVLSAQSFNTDSAFDAAGGDSLKGLELLVRLEALLGHHIAVGTLGMDTRPSELIERLGKGAGTVSVRDNTRPQIVFFPGMWGDDVNTSDFCLRLSRHFGVIAIDPRLGGDALLGDYDATRYFTAAIEAIRRVGPHRRLWLIGFSYGGKLAVETARRLLASGTAVEAVVVLDGEVEASSRRLTAAEHARHRRLSSRLRSGLAEHNGVARYLLNGIVVRAAPIAVRFGATRMVRALLASVHRLGSAATYRHVSRGAIAQIRRRAFGILPAGPLPMGLWLLVTDDP